MSINTLNTATISLGRLFAIFLKVGAISFGGNIALVSMVQKELVEKYKVVDNSFFLNAISVASILPGPMAVNVVAYTGYYLKGKWGSLLSMFAVLLPSLVLMIFLSWMYFSSGIRLQVGSLLNSVIGTVCGIIFSVGASMFKKEIAGDKFKIAFTLAALAFLFFFNSYFVTMVFFLIAAGLGILITKKCASQVAAEAEMGKQRFAKRNWVVLSVLLITQLLFATKSIFLVKNLLLKILLVFCGISLSLFGGGYVMIPIMQTLFVNDLQWVSTKEFIDAIAFSQVTPGPILVSATFIGYKLGGLGAAFMATIAIFLPSAGLMIIVASVIQKNKENHILRAAMNGIKCVVIAMILAAPLKLLKVEAVDVFTVVLLIISFLLSYFKKVNPAYLILVTIVAGFLIYYI